MSEMISVAEGFQYSVNIAYDLHADDKLKSYIPTQSALQLMEDILQSTLPTATDRSRVLIGAYGKGKSHIVLTILALLMKRDLDIAIERLYFTSNQKTVIDVAQARGVIVLCAEQHQIPMYEYTPLQVKQAVVGYGKAEKRQVMDMTRRILKLAQIPKPDDAADALALAICHGHCATGVQLQKRIIKAGDTI